MECQDVLKHKEVNLLLEYFHKHDIRYTIVVQRPGEIVLTSPYAYHMGFNAGYNINVAVNMIAPYWIDFGLIATHCTCRGTRVRIPMIRFVEIYRPLDLKLYTGTAPEYLDKQEIVGAMCLLSDPENRYGMCAKTTIDNASVKEILPPDDKEPSVTHFHCPAPHNDIQGMKCSKKLTQLNKIFHHLTTSHKYTDEMLAEANETYKHGTLGGESIKCKKDCDFCNHSNYDEALMGIKKRKPRKNKNQSVSKKSKKGQMVKLQPRKENDPATPSHPVAQKPTQSRLNK